jgi:hypothetical protein
VEILDTTGRVLNSFTITDLDVEVILYAMGS